MQLGHLPLHRVERATIGEVFYGDDLGAIGLAGEKDARVHRLITKPAADVFPHHNGARAAVPFGASFLGTDGVLVKTKVIEQRQRRCNAGELYRLSSPQEPDFAPHDGLPRVALSHDPNHNRQEELILEPRDPVLVAPVSNVDTDVNLPWLRPKDWSSQTVDKSARTIYFIRKQTNFFVRQ
jgi:hypothetical protein